MNRGSVLFKWILWLAIVGSVGVFGCLSLVKHVEHVAQGDEILWDDFGFSVVGHRTEKSIGDLVPKGIFHVVRLEVRNHALRVGYRLDNHRPVLMDDEGNEYSIDAAAQKVIDPSSPHTQEIAHGTNFASDLVFDVPVEAKNLRLRVSWGGGLIDFLDEHVFGPRDIALR
jgi:hypothetical protein